MQIINRWRKQPVLVEQSLKKLLKLIDWRARIEQKHVAYFFQRFDICCFFSGDDDDGLRNNRCHTNEPVCHVIIQLSAAPGIEYLYITLCANVGSW